MVHGGDLLSINRFLAQFWVLIREVDLGNLGHDSNMAIKLSSMNMLGTSFKPENLIVSVRWIPPLLVILRSIRLAAKLMIWYI